MFGVIVELRLKVVPNTMLYMDTIHCSSCTFTKIYSSIRADKHVEVKLSRLDITNPDSITIYVFRNAKPGHTHVTELPLHPNEMSGLTKILYKWLMPVAADLRSALEGLRGKALDFPESSSRNMLLFESAVPLAKLTSPLVLIDDSFVLQEFFVGAEYCQDWILKAGPIFQKHRSPHKGESPLVVLLNCTIRFVEHDTITGLPYANTPGGSYAFVLYYRIRRSSEADGQLEKIHVALADMTLALGGTFYLPYRHHYSFEQLEQAYPNFGAFCERKVHYDPGCMFRSLWWDHYGEHFKQRADHFVDARSEYHADNSENTIDVDRRAGFGRRADRGGAHLPPPSFQTPIVSVRRSNSYKTLFHNFAMRRLFFDGFLTQIFSLEAPDNVKNAIAAAVYDPANENDLDIFTAVQASLSNNGVGKMQKAWRSLNQLNAQRRELVRETGAILGRLGRLGNTHDYVSVGDAGKMILAFEEAFGMKGNFYVVNDKDDNSLNARLERCCSDPVAPVVLFRYDNPGKRLDLPDECADLVTMNQGLHHLEQSGLVAFLKEIQRVLRPGGLFLFREHDATPDLIPMLDLAHSVFNAVVGATVKDERTEIRAFRPVAEWRAILTGAGFTDTFLYEMEDGDPTEDEMLCFCKGALTDFIPREKVKRTVTVGRFPCASSVLPPEFVERCEGMLRQIPTLSVDLSRAIVVQLTDALDVLRSTLEARFGTGIKQATVYGKLDAVTKPILLVLRQLKPYLEGKSLTQKYRGTLPVPLEIWLLLTLILERAADGSAAPEELIIADTVKKVQSFLAPSPDKGTGAVW